MKKETDKIGKQIAGLVWQYKGDLKRIKKELKKDKRVWKEAIMQKAKTIKLKDIRSIKNMSLHDKVVYRITRRGLKEGDETVTIGDRVVARDHIARLLKKNFPNTRIYYWLTNQVKVEII